MGDRRRLAARLRRPHGRGLADTLADVHARRRGRDRRGRRGPDATPVAHVLRDRAVDQRPLLPDAARAVHVPRHLGPDVVLDPARAPAGRCARVPGDPRRDRGPGAPARATPDDDARPDGAHDRGHRRLALGAAPVRRLRRRRDGAVLLHLPRGAQHRAHEGGRRDRDTCPHVHARHPMRHFPPADCDRRDVHRHRAGRARDRGKRPRARQRHRRHDAVRLRDVHRAVAVHGIRAVAHA